MKSEQTKLTDYTELHCVCSVYDNGRNEGGKVRLFECVLDGRHKTPCWYVLMPERTWYDHTKSYKIESILRRYWWHIRYFLWVRKRRDKKVEAKKK